MTRVVTYMPPPEPILEWYGIDISGSPHEALEKAVEVIKQLHGEGSVTDAAGHYESFFSAASELVDMEEVFPGVSAVLEQYAQRQATIAEETREWRVPSHADSPLMIGGAAVAGLFVGYAGHRLGGYVGAGVGVVVGIAAGGVGALLGIGQVEITNDIHLQQERNALLRESAQEFMYAIDELVKGYH